jgi:gluconate kinase
MKADMLASQFAALEEPNPQEAFIIDAAQTVPTIVAQILDVGAGLVPAQS